MKRAAGEGCPSCSGCLFFQTSEALLPRILEREVPRGLFPCAGLISRPIHRFIVTPFIEKIRNYIILLNMGIVNT